MANAHELARGHKRLRALIEFALAEGWHVKRTPGGHLKFTKRGCAPIYTSSTASDHRASLNARAQIRRADREVGEVADDRLGLARGAADAARAAHPFAVQHADRKSVV